MSQGFQLSFIFCSTARTGSNKFADASKVLYGESLKHNGNGNHQFAMHGALMNANGAPSNGTMSSIRSAGMEHRMSLNINPLNELEESYGNNEVCTGFVPVANPHKYVCMNCLGIASW